MDNNIKLLAVAGGALVVMACQSPLPRNPSLEQARFLYQTTRADPYLAELAAEELKHARRTLRAAERVWADGGDEATTRTLARMVARQVEHARSLAGQPTEPIDLDAAPPLREAGVVRTPSTLSARAVSTRPHHAAPLAEARADAKADANANAIAGDAAAQ